MTGSLPYDDVLARIKKTGKEVRPSVLTPSYIVRACAGPIWHDCCLNNSFGTLHTTYVYDADWTLFLSVITWVLLVENIFASREYVEQERDTDSCSA